MLAELDQVRDGERGKVRLGSFQSVSVHLAPPLLARLRDELPLVEVELFETDDEIELEHMLLSGELDATFLVMQEEGDPSGMHLTELLRDRSGRVPRTGCRTSPPRTGAARFSGPSSIWAWRATYPPAAFPAAGLSWQHR